MSESKEKHNGAGGEHEGVMSEGYDSRVGDLREEDGREDAESWLDGSFGISNEKEEKAGVGNVEEGEVGFPKDSVMGNNKGVALEGMMQVDEAESERRARLEEILNGGKDDLTKILEVAGLPADGGE